MDNVKIALTLLALLGFVGALVFNGPAHTACLIVAVTAAVVGLLLEVRTRRARTTRSV